MASKQKLTPLERWKELVKKVSSGGAINPLETPAQQAARIERARADYDFFVTYYFPHLAPCPCAPFHISAANELKNDPYYHGIWEWGRGLAKSVNADIFDPLWLKFQKVPLIHTMVLVGKNNKVATRLLQDIQAELAANPRLIHDFGPQIRDGSWEQGQFVCNDGFAAVAYGMGEPPRGTRFGANRPDYIVCDDLDDDKLKKNPLRLREAVEWIYRAVLPTMDAAKPGRFVFVNNRICKNGILATLVSERPHWSHVKVNALKDDGTPSWPAKDSVADYERIRADVGYKAFQTEYQNDPVEDGGVFTEEQIIWEQALDDLTQYDALVMYGDPAFGTGPASDYFAIKFWALRWLVKGTDGSRRGDTKMQLMCLKARVRQTESPAKLISWWFDFYYALPVAVRDKLRCYVEANATQKMLLKPLFDEESARRGLPLFVRYDTDKKGDKVDRIAAMQVQYENDCVRYAEAEKSDPDMLTGIGMLTGWEEGARHDDAPDADESAWKKLFSISPRSGRRTIRSGTAAPTTTRRI